MLHLSIITLFAALAIHDAAPPDPASLSPLANHAIAVTLGAFAAICIAAHLILTHAARSLARHGRPATVTLARRTLELGRTLAIGAYLAAVFLLDWPGAVRSEIGNPVLLDELLMVLPPLFTFVSLWWSHAPIERQLADARLLRHLDTNQPILTPITHTSYTLEQTRRHILPIAIPLLILTAWWEGTERLALIAGIDPLAEQSAATIALRVIQYAGLLAFLWMVPLLVTRLWPTTPLAPGPLRDRLIGLCNAQRLRVRRLLVWRTHDAMLNGALVGIAPPFRAILLTDSLLERLPAEQVEAVMAHEVAHAKRRHLPWLIVSMVVVAGAVWLAQETITGHPADRAEAVASLIITAALAITAFGFVSRLFERQADAFAAQHLSGVRPGRLPDPPPTIAPHAVAAMASALLAVAHINGANPRRFSFRHGSIETRVKNLHALAGHPAHTLPIDRRVRLTKRLLLAAAAAITIAALTLT